MPVPAPQLGSYQYVPETKVEINMGPTRTNELTCYLQEDLDWAELVTLDLSLYGTPEGNKQLAQALIKAVREKGFFYVINFNIGQERVNRQFSLGREFYELPLEEKSKYTPQGLGELLMFIQLFLASGLRNWTCAEAGQFNGYVPKGLRMQVFSA